MGITIFKIFIWGGISSDICSEITVYGSAHISNNIPPKMKILNSYLLIEINFFVHYLNFETTKLLLGQVRYGHLIVPRQVSNLDISTP